MDNSTQPQGSKTIRIPCTEQQYNVLLKNRKYFKNYIAELCESYPELFPELISEGYYLHGKTAASIKMDGLRLYRIRLIANGEVHTIAPSYIMPLRTGQKIKTGLEVAH